MIATPKGPASIKASYRELISFVRYFRHFGVPVIVGGWAVFFYNPYYGSVDIDVVGPGLRGAFEEIIEGYERSHGYEIVQQDPLGTEITARKPIYSKVGKRTGDMEIDACTYERTGASEFHEDTSKSLPYSLCERDACRKEAKIVRDTVCYVPCKALLALFKVKARRDRSYDIRTKGATMNPTRLDWLRGKSAKDGSDIIALLDPTDRGSLLKDAMDYPQMHALAAEFGLKDLVTDTLQEVLKDRRSLTLYGRSVDTSLLLKSVTRGTALGRETQLELAEALDYSLGLESNTYGRLVYERETLDGAIKIAVYHGAWNEDEPAPIIEKGQSTNE